MVVAHTIQESLIDISRCDDRSLPTTDEQSLYHKADRTDASIAEKVSIALWKYGKIDVDVKNGIVYLSGHVITLTIQKEAEDIARTMPGVLGVKSYLVSDDKLMRDVAGALGKIEHEYGVKFFTGVQNGVVVLNGEVNSADVRGLAEKCAAEIPGIRGVINAVRVPGVDLQGEDQRFFQPSVGELIYFRDGRCGTVHKLIMNPNNRRVMAMIVRGRYPNSPKDSRSLMYGEPPVPERLIVIPVSAIRYITNSSGFLHIDSAEAASYSDFDPSCFRAPGEAWAPPYPYCPDDILFTAEPMIVITEHGISPTLLPGSQPVVSVSGEETRERTFTQMSKN